MRKGSFIEGDRLRPMRRALMAAALALALPAGIPVMAAAQHAPGQNSAQSQRSGAHRGDWLRKYGNLPPDQQRQQLEQDNLFRSLPAERQQRLRDRLERFNKLPQQDKDRVLKRMEVIEKMPPEQQQRVEGLFQQFRALDPERRRAVVQQLKSLRTLPVDQRGKALETIQGGFNDQERQLLRGLNDLGIQMEAAGVKGPGF